MEEKIVVGVDIGTTKIACFIGKPGKTPGKINILGFARTDSNGVKSGVVQNLQETAEAIKKAIVAASEQANVNVDDVYIGVAGNHIKTKLTDTSIPIPVNEYQIISKDDVDRLNDMVRTTAVIEEGEEIIHIFPQHYNVDGVDLDEDTSPIGVSGKILKGTFSIVTGKYSEIRKLMSCVKMAGYEVKGIVLEPVASAYATLAESDRQDGIALVDIGGGTTDIAVLYKNNIRFTSVIPIAGVIITQDISKQCQIVPSRAEQLKKKFGCCVPSAVNDNKIVSIPLAHGQRPREINVRTLAEIIKPRVEMIFDMVTYELECSKYRSRMLNGIALTGGGACMSHIKELAMLRTGIHCHISSPATHLEPLENTAECLSRMEEYNNPMYSTGIGLVIFGLEQEMKTIEEAPEQEPIEEAPVNDNPDISTFIPEPVVEPKPNDGGKKPGNPILDPIQRWFKKIMIDPMDE